MKRDWAGLTIEFVSCDMSLLDFAMEKNIPYGTITKYAAKLKWLDKRKETNKKAERKSLDYIADNRASQLAEQNERDIQGAKVIYNEIMAQIEAGGLSTKDIRALAGSLKDVQLVARLALGASTESTDVNVDMSFESWINERIAD